MRRRWDSQIHLRSHCFRGGHGCPCPRPDLPKICHIPKSHFMRTKNSNPNYQTHFTLYRNPRTQNPKNSNPTSHNSATTHNSALSGQNARESPNTTHLTVACWHRLGGLQNRVGVATRRRRKQPRGNDECAGDEPKVVAMAELAQQLE